MGPGVLVGKVHRIARKLDSAARSALHEVGILIACKWSLTSLIWSGVGNLTNNFPNEVSGDIWPCRHLVQVSCSCEIANAAESQNCLLILCLNPLQVCACGKLAAVQPGPRKLGKPCPSRKAPCQLQAGCSSTLQLDCIILLSPEASCPPKGGCRSIH